MKNLFEKKKCLFVVFLCEKRIFCREKCVCVCVCKSRNPICLFIAKQAINYLIFYSNILGIWPHSFFFSSFTYLNPSEHCGVKWALHKYSDRQIEMENEQQHSTEDKNDFDLFLLFHSLCILILRIMKYVLYCTMRNAK